MRPTYIGLNFHASKVPNRARTTAQKATVPRPPNRPLNQGTRVDIFANPAGSAIFRIDKREALDTLDPLRRRFFDYHRE